MNQGYKDLSIWQDSIELVELIYRLTDKFPSSEKFGLISQMRRSSVSVPSNIAEGWSRKLDKVYLQFVRIAQGSAAELETQIIISGRLNFTTNEDIIQIQNKLISIQKRIRSLASYLEEKIDDSENEK
jgi:four helix bundle protein